MKYGWWIAAAAIVLLIVCVWSFSRLPYDNSTPVSQTVTQPVVDVEIIAEEETILESEKEPFALEAKHELAEKHANQARTSLGQYDYAAALAYIGEALKLDGENTKHQRLQTVIETRLKKQEWETLSVYAGIVKRDTPLDQKGFIAIVEKFGDGLKLDGDKAYDLETALIFASMVSTSLDQKGFATALEMLNEALKLDGDNVVYQKLKEIIQEAKAKDDEEKHLALESKRKQAAEHAGQASAYLGQKRYADAWEAIVEALNLDGDNVEYVNLKETICEVAFERMSELEYDDAEYQELELMFPVRDRVTILRRISDRKMQQSRKSKELRRLMYESGKRKAGDRMVLTIEEVDYAFRWCPAGTFMMGSPESESGRSNLSEKQHEVTLTQGFWILETQVTQEMWESVTGENPSKFKDSKKLPVEQVSWEDCQDYIQKLNALGVTLAGYKFSLPTEAQWEYACRAGTTTAYCFGEYSQRELEEYTWYSGHKDIEEWRDRVDEVRKNGKTHPVGEKTPNAWGLYDMHGNVYEWCLDWYKAYSNDSETDPTGASDGACRILRGGSWWSSAEMCRSASRNLSAFPTPWSDNISVRLVLVCD